MDEDEELEIQIQRERTKARQRLNAPSPGPPVTLTAGVPIQTSLGVWKASVGPPGPATKPMTDYEMMFGPGARPDYGPVMAFGEEDRFADVLTEGGAAAVGGLISGLKGATAGVLALPEAAYDVASGLPEAIREGTTGPLIPSMDMTRGLLEGDNISRYTGSEPGSAAYAAEQALEFAAGGVVPVVGMVDEALRPLNPLTRAAAALRSGKPLSQAERVAVMDAVPGATRVTPEGAVTVAGKETSVEEMILEANRAQADPVGYPPMDSILPPPAPLAPPGGVLGTPGAASHLVQALTGGSFGQAVQRGLNAVRALPAEAVGEALDLLPPSVSAYLKGGRKQAIGGAEWAKGVQEFQKKFENIPGLSESKGASVRLAFQRISESPGEAMAAVYDNLMYGTPVPEAIREEFSEAMPALRRALSDLQELRREINPDDLEQYPIWFKRMFEEPLEARAAKGLGPGGPPVPGVAARHEAQDAYILGVTNLSKSEAEEIIARLPKNERPIQFAAPGRSKGSVTGTETPEWVGEAFGDYGHADLKWPDTKAGRRGRERFREMVENDRTLSKRKIEFRSEDPIRTDPDDPDSLTEVKDLVSVVSRSWSDVLRDKVTKEFFGQIPSMKNDAGEPLARFVSWKDYRKGGAAPEGYEFMLEKGQPSKRWGVLDNAAQGEEKGLYAVRSEVASYLREASEQSARLSHVAHGALDRWAINATNAPKTGIMNWLYNKVVVETVNGIYPGSAVKGRAREMVRTWENSGAADPLLEKAMKEGLPLRKPEKGMASLDDTVDSIFTEHSAAKNADYERGARLYDNLAGSPLAEQPVRAALGAAGQGALRGVAEGSGPLGIAIEAAAGAAETTALRPVAQAIRERYVNSDLFTTVAVFLKRYDEALAAGLEGDDAVRAAVARTNKLTQAGLWGDVGGFSEAFGAARSGLAGGERTLLRAAQKGLVNRFVKFHEVNARLHANALEDSWATAAGAALGAGAYYAIKEGPRKAAESLGILSPEDSAFVDANIPDAIVVPIVDAATGKPELVTFPGQSVGAPVADIPDTAREAVSWLTGPAFATTVEAVGGEKAQSMFTGGPLQRNEPEEGTRETPGEALIRSNQGRWMSPYASTGRLAQSVREGAAVTGTEREGRTPPSIPMIIGGLVMGTVRPLVPEELREANRRAFGARRSEIERLQRSAKGAAVPGKEEAALVQEASLVADLAEEYLRKGMKLEDLSGLKNETLEILKRRGWPR